MSDFSDSLDRVGVVLKEQAGQGAVYQRGDASVSLTVTPQGQRRQETAVGGIVLEEDIRHDFTFDSADLVLGMAPATPQRGDRLLWGGGVYEVVPIDDQTYTYVTSSRRRVRIHTRKVNG